LILVGDIASPDRSASEWLGSFFARNYHVFDSQRIICNFEGLVYDGVMPSVNEPVLFNHPLVLKTLNNGFEPVLCLANNHVADLPEHFKNTVRILNEDKICFAGAGSSGDEAEAPLFIPETGHEVILFNACWDFLLYNHRNPSGGVHVSVINEERMIKQVTGFHKQYPLASIIVFLHWSLDLETLPFPMYRQFARDLIIAGASIVAGSHSHCVQGGEKYNDGYIVYGLGNFYIPHNRFVNGKLNYPDFSSIELALEWDPVLKQVTCHWFEYSEEPGSQSLNLLGSEKFEESEKLKEFSPYLGMSDIAYNSYFRKKRRKRILIPVYKDYRNKLTNYVFTEFLKARARTARFFAKQGIIRWQR
jgi:poly-gamma-glutamate synthesis protein (capsule biosynthesis protein)